MKPYCLAMLMLLPFSPAQGAEPAETIILQAPDTCVVGELVTLDASSSASKEVEWKVLRVDSGLDECLDFKAFGKVACFSAREPSQWLVIISGVDAGGKPAMQTHSILVDGGGSPSGPSTPSLESRIRTWSKKVESDNLREEAIKLAQSFRALAAAELPVNKVLEATALANKQALGESLEAWIPFLDALGTYLDDLGEAGGLESREQYERVWNDIADSIERTFK